MPSRIPRIPLSSSDVHAINALHAASGDELREAMLVCPTYQRTAVRELVRCLEAVQARRPAAAPNQDQGGDDDAS
jgi:hypothetical protein